MSYPGSQNRRGGDSWRASSDRYNRAERESAGYQTSTAPLRGGGHQGYRPPYNDRGAPHPSPNHHNRGGGQSYRPLHNDRGAPHPSPSHHYDGSTVNQIPLGPRNPSSNQDHNNVRLSGPSSGGTGPPHQNNKRMGDGVDNFQPAKKGKPLGWTKMTAITIKTSTTGGCPRRPDPILTRTLHPLRARNRLKILERSCFPVKITLAQSEAVERDYSTLQPLEDMAQINCLVDHHTNRTLKVANSIYQSFF
jgi:hypothetical protein